jgi:predicted kinase
VLVVSLTRITLGLKRPTIINSIIAHRNAGVSRVKENSGIATGGHIIWAQQEGEGMSALLIFSGLPGTGKTSIARELARQLGALYLRIDSIEQAILESAISPNSVEDAGYRVGYSIAEDNLRLKRDVVADSVNGWPITRDAWLSAAKRAQAVAVEIEIICSDIAEHRRRLEARTSDIPGLKLPTWQDIEIRGYVPWDRTPVLIDTAHKSLEQSVRCLMDALSSTRLGYRR